jgi:peptidoglycan/xylan/chitin deacetylase (PgdA/CDA1 family)
MHSWLSSAVRGAGLTLLCVLLGCATVPPSPAPAPRPVPEPEAEARPTHGVIARNERFVLYVPAPEDSLESIAGRFLGSEARGWEIADFNNLSRVEPGTVLAVPLRPVNPHGVVANGYQTVPILCYHRVGPGVNRMIMTPTAFAAQLEFLARNNYRVIRLRDLTDFLEGRAPLPQRAVVLTFDDGHVSAYHHVFPLLKKYGFPATFFLYTDFLNTRDGLSWAQIREMAATGLADFQPHSKTHSNLIVRRPGETDQQYRSRLDSEIRIPRDLIQRNVGNKVSDYAYPYGDANEIVLEHIAQTGYRLGLTVNAGGNPFFSHPLMLRRTMIYGEHNLEAFKAALQVFRAANLK